MASFLQPRERLVALRIHDTSGEEEHPRLRAIAYKNVDLILLCFNIALPQNLDNIHDKAGPYQHILNNEKLTVSQWLPEIRRFMDGVPIILVGCKKDLRSDHKKLADEQGWPPEQAHLVEDAVMFFKGLELAGDIGALRYFECSSKTGEGVKEIFDQVASVVITYGKKRKVERKKTGSWRRLFSRPVTS
jgi:GTPase SAR1 family protein